MQISHLLAKNAALRGRHRGRRAFVIGNGPSIARHDLGRLRDDVTITVNQFQRHPQLEELRPPYWMIADPLFWEQPDPYLFPVVRKLLETGIHTHLFCPLGGAQVLCSTPTGPLIDPHFFTYGEHFAGPGPIDLSRPIPHWGQNVIGPAIMLAFHLGCDPIYLIGCDHDFLKIEKQDYEGALFGHGFASKLTPASDRYDWDTWSYAMKRTLWEYERLRDYADVWGQRIYNATLGGYLEVFPRVDFDAVLAEPASALVDPHALARRAVTYLNEGDPLASDLLLAEAARQITPRTHVSGITALRAVCAARQGDLTRAHSLAARACRDGDDPAGLAASIL